MIFKINTQKTKLQKGFLITEVLVTMFLIVITMVGILPLLFGGIKSSKVSKLRAVMTSSAQKEIESFNQKKFASLSGELKAMMGDDRFNEFITAVNPNYLDVPETFCVNPVKGTISSDLSAACPKKLLIKKEYSYLIGQPTVTDDVIQYSVTVTITGETTKPVILSAILSKDKI